MITFSVTGVIGLWVWSRVKDIPAYKWTKKELLQVLLHSNERNNYAFPTEEERKSNLAATDALIQKIGDEYPSLKIENHPIPDAENGFLQFYLFGREYDSIKSPDVLELQRFIADDRSDTNEAKRLLTRNAESIARIEAIAALDQRSNANMPDDYNGFITARSMKYAADVLMLKARLAAEAHDEPEALRFTKAALNLGTHMRQVETPNLLGETLTILIDLSVAKKVFQHVLPALGREANLAQWKAALGARPYSPADFAEVMRGEWNTTMRYYLFPVLVNPSHENRPKDADEFAHVVSFHYYAFIMRLRGMSLAEMQSDPGITVPGDLKKLSAKSREIYDLFMVGSKSWSRGYLRAAVTLAQYQAAFDLLMLEKAGTQLTRDSTEGVSRDPLAGKPFDFDPATRTLTRSPSGIDPLKLPF